MIAKHKQKYYKILCTNHSTWYRIDLSTPKGNSMSKMKNLAIEIDYLYEQMKDGSITFDDAIYILVVNYGFERGAAERLMTDNETA